MTAKPSETQGHMSKEELQEDAFVAGAVKAADYARQNKKSLITLLIVVLVAVVGIRMFMAYRAEMQGQANVLLNRGSSLFAAEEYQLANGFFQQVVDEYSGSNAAGYAVYYLAMAAWRQDDLATAEDYWREYLDDYRQDEMIASIATSGLAVCSESRGEYSEAAALFQQAAQNSKANPWASHNLFQAALCLEALADHEAALELLEQIQSDYPDAPESRNIEMYLERVQYKMNNN